MFTEGSQKPTHLVMYTDGGCWNDLRIGGWGIHGYFYVDEPAKMGTGCKKAQPTKKGYELGKKDKPEITVTHYVDGFCSIPTNATNNIAELLAAIKTYEIAIESGVKHVLILPDSQYVIKGIAEWSEGWIRNNWMTSGGTPVMNKDLWIRMLELISKAKELGINIEFKWVKGHSGEFGNEIVDMYAKLSMRAALNGRPIEECQIKESKGYWKQTKSHSRLLNLPAWYFGVRDGAVHKTEDGRTVYYQGDLREAEEFNGKMISNATFSVVYLKEADEVLETIRAESHKLAKASFYGLAVGNLALLFKPANYDMITSYGTKFLTYDLNKNRLETFSKDVLVEERRPVRRAYYAVDKLEMLERVLKSFLAGDEDGFAFTEITDLLYETIDSKKSTVTKLRSNITQSLKTLKVKAKYRTPGNSEFGDSEILMAVAQDIPDRNTLSALADKGVKVHVVTWAESDSLIRFATIIQTDEDVGIWSGVYANLHVVPPSK